VRHVRLAVAVVLGLVALVFAVTVGFEIVDAITGHHRGPIHPAKYMVGVALTVLFGWIAFWFARRYWWAWRDG
jgi:uncharacterized membrane protein